MTTGMFGITVAEPIFQKISHPDLLVIMTQGRPKDIGILLIIVTIINIVANSAAYAHFGSP